MSTVALASLPDQAALTGGVMFARYGLARPIIHLVHGRSAGVVFLG